MDPYTALKTLLPTLPHVLGTAAMHILGLSDQSKHMDLRSALIIAFLRAVLHPSQSNPRSILSTQSFSLRSQPVKGNTWVSTYASLPPPETSVRDVVIRAIIDMRDPSQPVPDFKIPDIVPVEAEWTGNRAAGGPKDPLPELSAKETYDEMMKECTHPSTILYLHGGYYCLLDPATHRDINQRLAKLTGGRTYSVRYRLAPQNPFPAALVDALLSYLTLLYPPPDAYHEPVKPEHIVFAGDSAGGNLVFALTQLILEIRRKGTKVMWHGLEREVPLPAGASSNSPWLDITMSLPPWGEDSAAPFDYLPMPAAVSQVKVKPSAVWPANPPRKLMFVDDDLASHPLVSVLMSDDWKGAPPMYICTGWESLTYEDRYMAQLLYDQGVPIVFEEYEAMAHCFAMIIPRTDIARRCVEGWASFIRGAVEDASAIESSAVMVKAPTLEEVQLDLSKLCPVGDGEIRNLVRDWQDLGRHVPAKL